jgi:protein ImuB
MFAVIYLPQFCLQAALRHAPELLARPMALIDPTLTKPLIFQLTAAARKQGVQEGLTASQALARCPELIIKSRSTVQEEMAQEVLMQTAYAFSPHLEATAAGICTLELRGLRFETETSLHEWAAGIREQLQQFHLDAQIGVCTTPALALLIARAAQPVSVVVNAEEFVAGLPIHMLEPPVELAEILRRWGIKKVGEFLNLGKNQCIARLGEEALALFDRVSPASVRPLKLVSPPEEYSEQMEFDHEIETIEPLLFVLRRFVEQLSQRLALAYQVTGELLLRLQLASGGRHDHHFKIPSPTGNVDSLFRTLQTHLENVRTDSPIISLRLSAKPSLPDAHQFGLFEATLRNPNQFTETLARLSALCGAERVGTPELVSTHKPDSFRMRAPDFNSPGNFRKIKTHGPQLRRFRPPILATVEFRDQKPALIRSQIWRGPINDARGPFVSSGEWWDVNRWSREEWDIQTADGALYRIYRSHDGTFVEGIYD